MATSGKVIERFAPVAGLRPSAVDRMLRPLRSAGLAPMGERGRGQRLGHFEPPHLVSLILGFAGPEPSDAADAAKLLRELPYARSFPPTIAQIPQLSEGMLGQALERIVDEIARSSADIELHPLPQSIELCLHPLHALLTWFNENGALKRRDMYLPTPSVEDSKDILPHVRNTIGVQRKTFLHPGLILLAAELWRDTMEHQGHAPTTSFPAPERTTSGHGKAEAAVEVPPSATASTLGQSALPQTSSGHNEESKGVEGGFPPSSPRPDRSPAEKGRSNES